MLSQTVQTTVLDNGIFPVSLWQVLMQYNSDYRQIYNIRRIKSQTLNVSHFVLQLSLPNPLNPGVKSKTKNVDARPIISEWSTILLLTNMRLILEFCHTESNQTGRISSIAVYSLLKAMVSTAAYIISTHICFRFAMLYCGLALWDWHCWITHHSGLFHW